MGKLSKHIAILLIGLIVGGPSGIPCQRLLAQATPLPVNPGAGRVGGSSFGSSTSRPQFTPYSPTIQLPETPPFSGTIRPGIIAGQPIYQIHILGEVQNPGTYRVPASIRLSEAIEQAGNTLERGSQRRIELRRRGEATKSVDLLNFKQFGNLEDNPYLLDNDVIFVPLRKTVVRIAGAVKRPDTYELTREKTVADLVALAGGYTPGVARGAAIKVIRHNDHNDGQMKSVIDVIPDQNSLKSLRLENADVVVVPHFLTHEKKFDYNLPSLPGDSEIFYPSYEERVFVLGAVTQPGPLPYSPYYHVREYLTIAGGLTKLAKSGKKIKVMSSAGKVSKAKMDTSINPGDTIIVPERYMRPENWAMLILGISSAALGLTTTILTLTR